MSLFTNGNARVTRLIIMQLGLAQLSLLLMAVQGYLPTLDLTAKQLRYASFSIAIALVAIRAGEMFFNKVASLLKSPAPEVPPVANPLSTGNTDLITKQQEIKTP